MADCRARGLGSTRNEQTHFVHDGGRRQRLAIDFGVQPQRDQVVGRAGHLLLCDLAKGTDELHVGVDEVGEDAAVALAHVDAHQPFAPTLEFAPHGLGIAQQSTRESGWQLARDCVDEFAFADVDDVVDEFGDKRIDLGATIADSRAGELVLHEHALLAMPRIVLSDHVDLVGRPDSAIALTAEVHAAAPLNLHQIGVTGDAPQAVAMVAIDRFVGAHPRIRVVRIRSVELWVEKIDHQTFVAHSSHSCDLATKCACCATPT